MITATWALFAGLALADWYTVARNRLDLETIFKPAALLALLLVAVSMGALDDPAGRWLAAALAFGLLGDVMLLSETDRRFRLGLAAFFVGHLAYLLAFFTFGLEPTGWSWLVVAILVVTVVATRRVVPRAHAHGGATLSVPVAAYTLVIGGMLVAGFLTGEPWVALGAAIFVISDSTLAINRFVRPLPRGHLAVMITYHLAQALIVLGLLT